MTNYRMLVSLSEIESHKRRRPPGFPRRPSESWPEQSSLPPKNRPIAAGDAENGPAKTSRILERFKLRCTSMVSWVAWLEWQ